MRWRSDVCEAPHLVRNTLRLRGGLPIVNGRPICEEDLLHELKVRTHNVICESGELTWLFGPSYHSSVKSLDGLKDGAHYVTARSSEHAYRIHVRNLENGVLDLEPLATALRLPLVLFGASACISAALFGASACISAVLSGIGSIKSASKPGRRIENPGLNPAS